MHTRVQTYPNTRCGNPPPIAQTSCVPGAANTILITLALSVDLDPTASAYFDITGLAPGGHRVWLNQTDCTSALGASYLAPDCAANATIAAGRVFKMAIGLVNAQPESSAATPAVTVVVAVPWAGVAGGNLTKTLVHDAASTLSDVVGAVCACMLLRVQLVCTRSHAQPFPFHPLSHIHTHTHSPRCRATQRHCACAPAGRSSPSHSRRRIRMPSIRSPSPSPPSSISRKVVMGVGREGVQGLNVGWTSAVRASLSLSHARTHTHTHTHSLTLTHSLSQARE